MEDEDEEEEAEEGVTALASLAAAADGQSLYHDPHPTNQPTNPCTNRRRADSKADAAAVHNELHVLMARNIGQGRSTNRTY